MHRRLLLLAFCTLACGFACARAVVLAEVTLNTADYNELQSRIAAHRGQVVVMDVWSTSCEPCMKEFPNLVALSRKLGDRVACISVSIDYEGIGKPEAQREKVLTFLRSQDATIENVLASEESDAILKKLGLASIPAVFVYGRDGKLAETFDKPGFTYHDVERRVSELLAK